MFYIVKFILDNVNNTADVKTLVTGNGDREVVYPDPYTAMQSMADEGNGMVLAAFVELHLIAATQDNEPAFIPDVIIQEIYKLEGVEGNAKLGLVTISGNFEHLSLMRFMAALTTVTKIKLLYFGHTIPIEIEAKVDNYPGAQLLHLIESKRSTLYSIGLWGIDWLIADTSQTLMPRLISLLSGLRIVTMGFKTKAGPEYAIRIMRLLDDRTVPRLITLRMLFTQAEGQDDHVVSAALTTELVELAAGDSRPRNLLNVELQLPDGREGPNRFEYHHLIMSVHVKRAVADAVRKNQKVSLLLFNDECVSEHTMLSTFVCIRGFSELVWARPHMNNLDKVRTIIIGSDGIPTDILTQLGHAAEAAHVVFPNVEEIHLHEPQDRDLLEAILKVSNPKVVVIDQHPSIEATVVAIPEGEILEEQPQPQRRAPITADSYNNFKNHGPKDSPDLEIVNAAVRNKRPMEEIARRLVFYENMIAGGNERPADEDVITFMRIIDTNGQGIRRSSMRPLDDPLDRKEEYRGSVREGKLSGPYRGQSSWLVAFMTPQQLRIKAHQLQTHFESTENGYLLEGEKTYIRTVLASLPPTYQEFLAMGGNREKAMEAIVFRGISEMIYPIIESMSTVEFLERDMFMARTTSMEEAYLTMTMDECVLLYAMVKN